MIVGIVLSILAVLNLATLAASILNLAAASNFHDETKLYLDACVGDLCDDMEQLRSSVEDRVDHQSRLTRKWTTQMCERIGKEGYATPPTISEQLEAKMEEVRQHKARS